MKLIEKELFMKRSFGALNVIYEQIKAADKVNLKDFPANETAIVVVDMINGFTREGLLKSHRIEELINPMVELLKAAKEKGIQTLVFADSHPENSPEFATFPPHCLEGTNESEVVDEIKEVGNYRLIAKNSTNGFLEEEFQVWLKENPQVKNFIVIGDCTDICIMQFATTLKTYFNKKNAPARIVVPTGLVETYELEEHNADLMNVMALYMMKMNDLEIVSQVKL